MKKTLAISSETFQKNAEKWLTIVRYNESGLIINYVGDHFFTIPELLRNKLLLKKLLGKYHQRYIIIYNELSSSTTSDELRDNLVLQSLSKDIKVHPKDTLEQVIDSIVNAGYEIAFFLSRVERLVANKSELLSHLEFVARNHRVSFLYFSELNLTNFQFLEQQRELTSMFQNIIYQEIYGIKDAEEFIAYNEKLWNITLSASVKGRIIEKCGGNLWLLRQAMRLVRNYPDYNADDILTSPQIYTKALASWSQLFPNEQKVVEDIIFDKKQHSEDFVALDYLLRIHFIEKKGIEFRLSIPLLGDVVRKPLITKGFFIDKGSTFYNSENLSSFLTYKEDQLLRYFIKNIKVLIKREKIGEAVWGSKNISPWALEKTVSKLRKKLISVGLSKDVIVTKKGVGYVFSG